MYDFFYKQIHIYYYCFVISVSTYYQVRDSDEEYQPQKRTIRM